MQTVKRAVAVTLAAVAASGFAAAQSAAATPIVGSGKIVAKQFPVGSFSRLDVQGPFDVRISVGSAERVVVRIDDNLVDTLDVGVRNGTLHIGLKRGTSIKNATLRADVTVTSLDELDANGAARVRFLDELHSQALSLELSGASRLDGRVVTPSGKLELTGASSASMSGSASSLDVTATGACSLDARNLTIGALDIDLSGASRAVANVTTSLSAGLRGASSLRYLGSPTITQQSVTGASSLQQTT